MELYHYPHCPFCLRVRFALGYLQLSWKSIILPYDDEETPVKLTGKKMLPILKAQDIVLGESLDIIKFLDREDQLGYQQFKGSSELTEIENFLNAMGKPLHNLTMPHWVYTPEFNESSRRYFQSKKEQKRGSFSELLKNRGIWEAELVPLLKYAEENYLGNPEQPNIYDILLASHLWGLYVVPEFQFSPKMHSYLQLLKKACAFNYY